MSKTSIYSKKLTEFRQLIKKIEYLKSAVNSFMYWDKLTYMPKSGIEYRSQMMSFFADEQYRLLASPEFREYMEYFLGNKKNDLVTNAMLKRIVRSSGFLNKVPEEEYQRYIELIARSEQIWQQARGENNFDLLKPYIEEVFSTFRRFAEYWGYENVPYDAMLGYYEEGLTVEKVDALICELKPFLIELLAYTREKDVVFDGKASNEHYMMSKDDQEKLWELVLSKIGFDFDAGRIDIGAHPMPLAISPDDVRIVNTYKESDFRAGLFNALHSGGKGIYQQSISKDLLGSFLCDVPSSATEECIGRFYENIIGRSKGFWNFFFDGIKELSPEMKSLNKESLFKNVNRANPSSVRLEADQLTFLLHIIIRYELEKEIFNGSLKVEDIEAAWSQKTMEYLCVEPESANEGILQDIHWAAGYVGYFPTYIVSELTSAQLATSLEKECGVLDELVEAGNFNLINQWLTEKVYQWGAIYNIDELTRKATGEPLSSHYYMDYLRKKISEVYR